MRKRDKGFWIAYLVFAIIMLLIYKYIPAENGFLIIVLFPLIALANVFNYAFQGSMRRIMVGCDLLIFMYNLKVTFVQKQNEVVNQNKEKN
ncbi:hypothetical protein [Priestia megaterium]|uniref:hypothetical protein n=1 Tax=Priestia megaterium TaxID=1404 RepID=UPI0031FDF285